MVPKFLIINRILIDACFQNVLLSLCIYIYTTHLKLYKERTLKLDQVIILQSKILKCLCILI